MTLHPPRAGRTITGADACPPPRAPALAHPAPRRSRLALALVVAGLVVLAACSTIRGVLDTTQALEREGFTEVDMSFDSAEGFDRVDVILRPASSSGDAEGQAEEAARVVWTTFPLRFDLLQVELLGSFEGSSTSTYTYGEMVELFGPRDPGFDDKELSDDVVRAGLGIAIVLAVGGIIFLAAVVLAIVMGVRTSRRRGSATPPPWPPVIRQP